MGEGHSTGGHQSAMRLHADPTSLIAAICRRERNETSPPTISASGAAALPAVSGIARAQAYPTRPVKIVVPVGPSGSYDIVGRALADQLAKRLDQTVVVENRAGAGTVVGTQAVIQSPADGYTLLVGGLSNVVFNVGLYNKPPYDPLKDLVPVALVFNVSYTLIGSKASPYAS